MKQNNIPAFPFTANANTGMTLRDYFASSALTGFLAKGLSMASAVKYSYEAADLMLEQREEKKYD
jgi:hypothetical protein